MNPVMNRYQAKLATPFCVLGIRTAGDCVREIVFLPGSHKELVPADRMAEQACEQLTRYIDDPEFRFDIRLQSRGTPFQRRVWDRIRAVAPRRTLTYGDLAADIGSAPRAVGQACGANPFPLVIPCHRVVSSTGLGGFAHREGGFHLSIKRWLLDHERSQP